MGATSRGQLCLALLCVLHVHSGAAAIPRVAASQTGLKAEDYFHQISEQVEVMIWTLDKLDDAVEDLTTVAPSSTTTGPTTAAPPTSTDGSTTDAPPTSTDGSTTDAPPTSTDGSTTDASPTSTDGSTTDAPPTSTDGSTTDAPPTSTDGSTTDAPPTSTDGSTTDAPPTSTDGSTTDAPPTSTDGSTTDASPTSTDGSTTDAPPTSTDGSTTDAPPTSTDGSTTDAPPTSTDGSTTDAPPTSTDGSTTDAPPTSTDGSTTDASPTSTDGSTTDAPPTSTDGSTTDAPPTSTDGSTTDASPTSTDGSTTDAPPTSTDGSTTDAPPTSTDGSTTDAPPTSTDGSTTDAPPTSTDGSNAEVYQTLTASSATYALSGTPIQKKKEMVDSLNILMLKADGEPPNKCKEAKDNIDHTFNEANDALKKVVDEEFTQDTLDALIESNTNINTTMDCANSNNLNLTEEDKYSLQKSISKTQFTADEAENTIDNILNPTPAPLPGLEISSPFMIVLITLSCLLAVLALVGVAMTVSRSMRRPPAAAGRRRRPGTGRVNAGYRPADTDNTELVERSSGRRRAAPAPAPAAPAASVYPDSYDRMYEGAIPRAHAATSSGSGPSWGGEPQQPTSQAAPAARREFYNAY